MQHITYGANTSYPVAILIKSYLIDGQAAKIKEHYVDPLVARGIPINDIIVIGLPYTDYKKVSAVTMKEAIPELQEFMGTCGSLHVLVADTAYLKKLAKLTRIVNLAGVLIPSVFGSQRLFKARVYTTYVFDDKAAERVQMSLDALVESYNGTYAEKDILVNAHYPKTLQDVKTSLDELLEYPALAVDIEGFGLRLDDAGIGTISFAWSKDSGIAFAVDYQTDYQRAAPNWEYRNLVLEFLLKYSDQGGITYYHGISYDVKQLVANLFMRNDLLDHEAMVDGVRTLTQNAHCTKDISFLATNSAAGNTLNLKHLILEYTGRYAIDVKDITIHKVQTVLEYNLKDTCGTFWLYEKNYPILVARKQEELYKRYQRNQRTLITIELTGMPLDMDEVVRLRIELDSREKELLRTLRETDPIKAWEAHKGVVLHEKYQESVKGEGRTLKNFLEWKGDEVAFKPTQAQALVWVLHTHFDLEIIDKTLKSREPSVADDTLEKHVQWIEAGSVVNSKEILQFLKDVREYLEVTKINGTFVKAFITKSILKSDGVYYLHGSLNQGGPLSGRLSSSDPNLQNLPSGGHWGKAIKRCFKPPSGYVMLGSDYAQLEARIAAMRTNDPQMRKVFTDGFDSHSLNTYAYADGTEAWYSKIKDPNDPASINLIKKLAEDERTDSKPTTFALQFLGTYRTLMNNQGYSEEKSKRLEKAFHDLYVVYFQKLDDISKQAAVDGFINVAYGLRIDAPACARSVIGSAVTPASVEAEIRSICNAICQSFGQMNTFAADDFMRRVWESKWKYSIHIQNLIHDAIYLFAPQDLECIEWVNKNLIECMCMQMEDTIKGSDVKLEANLDIFYTTWASACEVPNNATQAEIQQVIKDFIGNNNETT